MRRGILWRQSIAVHFTDQARTGSGVLLQRHRRGAAQPATRVPGLRVISRRRRFRSRARMSRCRISPGGSTSQCPRRFVAHERRHSAASPRSSRHIRTRTSGRRLGPQLADLFACRTRFCGGRGATQGGLLGRRRRRRRRIPPPMRYLRRALTRQFTPWGLRIDHALQAGTRDRSELCCGMGWTRPRLHERDGLRLAPGPGRPPPGAGGRRGGARRRSGLCAGLRHAGLDREELRRRSRRCGSLLRARAGAGPKRTR